MDSSRIFAVFDVQGIVYFVVENLRRRKMEALSTTTKTKRIKVKHPKRKLFRSSEPLLSVFMWGVNHTVRELSHISIPVMLMPDDFRAYSKIKVDNHAFNKENLPSHFKV